VSVLSWFRNCYFRSIAFSSLCFVVVHEFQELVISFMRLRAVIIDYTIFLVILPSAFVEAVVFFVIGYPIAYIPSLLLAKYFARNKITSALAYLSAGLVSGIIYLPLCALFQSMFSVGFPEAPKYIHFLVEFVVPMAAAGVLAGGIFYQCKDKSILNTELVSDQFI